MYALNAVSEYQAFVDDVNDALQKVRSTKSTIFFGDFNAHIGTDSETWKGIIGRQNRSSSDLQSRYFETRKAAALAVKMSKERSWEVVGWIPTINRQKSVLADHSPLA